MSENLSPCLLYALQYNAQCSSSACSTASSCDQASMRAFVMLLATWRCHPPRVFTFERTNFAEGHLIKSMNARMPKLRRPLHALCFAISCTAQRCEPSRDCCDLEEADCLRPCGVIGTASHVNGLGQVDRRARRPHTQGGERLRELSWQCGSGHAVPKWRSERMLSVGEQHGRCKAPML